MDGGALTVADGYLLQKKSECDQTECCVWFCCSAAVFIWLR